MDLRPVLYMWLNKPEARDEGDHHKASMKKSATTSTYLDGDGVRTWGDPFTMFDKWLDVDMALSRLDNGDVEKLSNYLWESYGLEGRLWEDWPEIPEDLGDALNLILSDIL
jgi:hypothetical protein